jgi:hypothetical protein
MYSQVPESSMNCQVPESSMNCQAPALEEIKKIYGQYYENPLYVYKICFDRYIVIMKKLPDTLTNEHRKNVVDPRYAKFRANKLEVCVIFDVNDPSQTLEHITNHYNDILTKYEVNNVVTPYEFEIDPEFVCAGGIHYFNDMCRAFYYRTRPFCYSGYWIDWDRNDNGQKKSEGNYLDGKMTDKWIEWHDNGQKKSEGNYLNDKKTGKWIELHDNGQKESEGNYHDGKKYWEENYQNGICVSYGPPSESLLYFRAIKQGLVDHGHKLIDGVVFLAGFCYIFRKL